MAISESERRKLWVRAGGRCTFCKHYLLEGKLTYQEIPLGEAAHIVGDKDTPGSPRGQHSLLPLEDRGLAENLLLACGTCHTEIDHHLAVGILDDDQLRRRKHEHEDEIRHQTGLTTDRRSAVVRVLGWVRGAAMELSKETAARAVVRSSNRFPLYLPSYDQQGVEVDLRGLPGEEDASPGYYRAAQGVIDDRIRKGLYEGSRRDEVQHLSVFAIARLPLLVYLGSVLDDGIGTDVYQRNRSTDNWQWPETDTNITFRTTTVRTGPADETDAALITNLSGTTHPTNLPEALADAPLFTLGPVETTPGEDIISTRTTLAAFERECRRFFSDSEQTRKPLQRLHVFGALPVSAAVTLGRCLKARDLRPEVVLYDLTPRGYETALTI